MIFETCFGIACLGCGVLGVVMLGLGGVVSKVLAGLSLALLTASAGLAWQLDRRTKALEAAEDRLAQSEKVVENLELALASAEALAATRRDRDERQRADEGEVSDVPAVFDCVGSPAIDRALGILRDRAAGSGAAVGGAGKHVEVRGVSGGTGDRGE